MFKTVNRQIQHNGTGVRPTIFNRVQVKETTTLTHWARERPRAKAKDASIAEIQGIGQRNAHIHLVQKEKEKEAD